jgi:hypothetical protein
MQYAGIPSVGADAAAFTNGSQGICLSPDYACTNRNGRADGSCLQL